MLLQELKAQIFQLPPSDRLALISVIVESLQDTTIAQPDRSGAIQRMRGLLKATSVRDKGSRRKTGLVKLRC